MLKVIKFIIFTIAILIGIPLCLLVSFIAWEWLDLSGVRKAARFDPRSQSEIMSEFVLNEGVSIEAKFDGDTVRIFASNLFERRYFWKQCELGAVLNPYRVRWYGSMGGSSAGASFGLSIGGCEGISRPVVGEGQIHFDSVEFAEKWIGRRPTFYKTVWNEDGLLISFALTPARSQLTVDVWQMCMNGKPYIPLGLPKNSEIKIIAKNEGSKIRPCVTVDKDAIEKTKAQWEELWRTADEHTARQKQKHK